MGGNGDPKQPVYLMRKAMHGGNDSILKLEAFSLTFFLPGYLRITDVRCVPFREPAKEKLGSGNTQSRPL